MSLKSSNINKKYVAHIVSYLTEATFSPLIFFLYLYLFKNQTLNTNIFFSIIQKLHPFLPRGTNVDAINILFFIMFSLILFSLYLFINFNLFKIIYKDLKFIDFSDARLSGWVIFPNVIGFINILFWIKGMEGNIFGFIFFIPMLIATIVQLFQLVMQNLKILSKLKSIKNKNNSSYLNSPSVTSNNFATTAFNTSKEASTEVFQTAKNIDWQPASLLKRYIASIIDQLIATVFIGLMKTFFIAKFFHNQTIASFILIFCYFGIYWIMIPVEFGATPGKKAMGLRIVSNDGDINPGYTKMILRETIGRFISTVTVVGYLQVFYNKDKRTWHDLIAKTKVIQYR